MKLKANFPKVLKSYHEGANAERTAILAKVRRLRKRPMKLVELIVLSELEDWLLKRNERYNKRKGGL